MSCLCIYLLLAKEILDRLKSLNKILKLQSIPIRAHSILSLIFSRTAYNAFLCFCIGVEWNIKTQNQVNVISVKQENVIMTWYYIPSAFSPSDGKLTDTGWGLTRYTLQVHVIESISTISFIIYTNMTKAALQAKHSCC